MIEKCPSANISPPGRYEKNIGPFRNKTGISMKHQKGLTVILTQGNNVRKALNWSIALPA
jgi:hypothetical protein